MSANASANECKANALKRGEEFTTKIKNRSMKLLIKFNCSLKNTLNNIKIKKKTVQQGNRRIPYEFPSASVVALVLAPPSEPIHRRLIV